MTKQPELKEEYLVEMRNMGMSEEFQKWMIIRDPETHRQYAKTLEEANIRLENQKRYVNRRNNKTFSVGGGLAASIKNDTKDKFEFRIRRRLVTPWEVVREEN